MHFIYFRITITTNFEVADYLSCENLKMFTLTHFTLRTNDALYTGDIIEVCLFPYINFTFFISEPPFFKYI